MTHPIEEGMTEAVTMAKLMRENEELSQKYASLLMQSISDICQINELQRELADERALCDRLRNAATSIGVTNIPWREADAAYRKARGM